MDRSEWLAARRKAIGGSDVAAILGLSRWKSQWDVYMSKTTDTFDSTDESPVLKRGRILEPAIASWYAEEHGVTLSHTDPNTIVMGPEEWMAASPDAFVNDGEYGLEVKSSRVAFGWGETGTDKVPVDYALQCHWYMACTGLKRWDVAVFLMMEDDFRWYRLNRDEAVIQRIVTECRGWWHKYIIGGEKPPIDGSNGASIYLQSKFPREQDLARAASEDERAVITKLESTKAQIRSLEDDKDRLQNILAERVGEREGLYWGGGKLTYKAQDRRTIDAKGLRAAHPEIAEEFERVSTSRVMRITVKE